jgi:predicted secreted protein
MSDSTTIALIIASFFPGTFAIFYISKMTNDVGNEIVTGVIRGIPISTKARWLVLHQTWVGYVLGAVGCGVMIAALNVQIAAHATDAGIQTLAYMAAFFGAFAAIIWVLGAVSGFIYYRSVLRQAEAD